MDVVREEQGQARKLAAIVLNWNEANMTIEAVKSLRSMTRVPDLILVVDNGSDSDCRETLQQLATTENVELRFLPENLGYAAGNNFGIRIALDKGCDWILVLNNDLTVMTDTASRLLSAAQRIDNVGLVSPTICSPRGEILFSGERFSWLLGGPRRNNGADILPGVALSPVASGACFLASREIFTRVGLLPEEYFLLWEDIEYSFRVSLAGFKNICVRNARAIHRASSTIGRATPLRTYFSMRNRLVFASRILNPLHFFLFSLHYLLVQAPITMAA